HMFAAAGLVVINKTDLLPYVDFDVDACAGYARALNPGVNILPGSATTGEGLSEWYDWIAVTAKRPRIGHMSQASVDKTKVPE
ncbi:hydrogenase accessory protein HypB, partial [Mycobacterium sp. ITM-2017-0098]